MIKTFLKLLKFYIFINNYGLTLRLKRIEDRLDETNNHMYMWRVLEKIDLMRP